MTSLKSTGDPTRYLLDTYVDWAKAQGVPLVEGESVDLLAVETRPWTRLGPDASAAFVNLAGRGDFVSLIVIDITPGGRIETRHMFDEMFLVLEGEVAAHIGGGPDDETDAFVVKKAVARELIAPMKVRRLTLQNSSTERPTRLVGATTLPFAMNFFRNERFLFETPSRTSVPRGAPFENDYVGPRHFRFEAAFSRVETICMPDASSFEIIPRASAMRAEVIALEHQSCGHIERHGAGTHILPLGEHGYTLSWKDGGDEITRHDWRFGRAFAPLDGWYHQHFNPRGGPKRLLAFSFGNTDVPIFARKIEREFTHDREPREAGAFATRIEDIWRGALAGTAP